LRSRSCIIDGEAVACDVGGFRIIARKNGAQVRLYSRPGNDLTHCRPAANGCTR